MSNAYGPYEYSRRVTIGGPNGTYLLESPWSSPCEFAIASISAGGSGGVCITDQDFPGAGVAVAATTAPSSDNMSAYPGTLLFFSAAQVIVPDSIFTPMAGNRLIIQLSGLAAASILITFIFRRQAIINATFPALSQVNPEDEALYHQLLARANQTAAAETSQTQFDVAGKAVEVGHGR